MVDAVVRPADGVTRSGCFLRGERQHWVHARHFQPKPRRRYPRKLELSVQDPNHSKTNPNANARRSSPWRVCTPILAERLRFTTNSAAGNKGHAGCLTLSADGVVYPVKSTSFISCLVLPHVVSYHVQGVPLLNHSTICWGGGAMIQQKKR